MVNRCPLIGFVLAYGSDPNGAALSRDTMLKAVLVASCFQIVAQFLAASYSDRNGRRGVFMLGAILTGVWAFVLFPLIDTGSFWMVVLAHNSAAIFSAHSFFNSASCNLA